MTGKFCINMDVMYYALQGERERGRRGMRREGDFGEIHLSNNV